MRLYLSTPFPWNSTYSDDTGRLFYKVECPYRKTTIYRSLPDISLPTSERQLWEERHYMDTHPSWSDHPESDGRGSGIPQDDVILEEKRISSGSSYEFQMLSSPQTPLHLAHPADHPFFIAEHWAHFADIDFHTVHATHFQIGANEMKASELFKKSGWSFYGKNRIFSTHGKDYKWEMGEKKVKLYQIEQPSPSSVKVTELLVAEFTPSHWESHQKRRTPPCLEIFSEWEHLKDIILVTLIYIERLRSERRDTTTTHTVRPSNQSLAVAASAV